MRQDQNQTTNRAAYSPAEFAGTCGRHPSWAYRLLYSGKIRAVTELGRILIPASELERVLSLAQPYDPKPKPKQQNQSEGGQS
ncbi:MAG: helix-turn-helix domain-containing protein [Candidatus Udaeobacter sp.]